MSNLIEGTKWLFEWTGGRTMKCVQKEFHDYVTKEEANQWFETLKGFPAETVLCIGPSRVREYDKNL